MLRRTRKKNKKKYEFLTNNPAYESKSLADYNSDFTVILIRHCQSCANVANPILGHTKKFWRQPLCTSEGVHQAIRTGIILPKILRDLNLHQRPPFGASILPRAFTTAKITSIPFDTPPEQLPQSEEHKSPWSQLPKYSDSDADTEPYNSDQESYPQDGGAVLKRTHSKKSYTPSSNSPSPDEIFRVAYIKEKMNPADPSTRFKKNTGPKQSQNLTSVHHSDSYLLAMNHIFKTIDGQPLGRHISMNTSFLEDIVGGNEHTSSNVRSKLIKSDWDSFEREVLPSLRSYSQSMGSNCVVLFVHGHLLEDALNRSSNNTKLSKQHRRVWKKATNPQQRRENLSVHSIGYNSDGSKTILTNHQLRHLPNVDPEIVQQYISLIDISDPVFNCNYKYHKSRSHIVSRANDETQQSNNYPLIAKGGRKKRKKKTRRKHKKRRKTKKRKQRAGGRDLCDAAYSQKNYGEEEYNLLKEEILKLINEGKIDEELISLSADNDQVDIDLTISNIANDYCNRLLPRSVCDQNTAKCRKY